MSDVISIYTPQHWDPADSYGLLACQLARHLTALGIYVNALGVGDREVETQPEDIRAITAQPVKASLGGIVLAYPTAYSKYGPFSMLGPRVAITMFESTHLPQGWAETLNQCQAVIVPSPFCAEVFRQSGVNVPVHVVPLGLGDNYLPSRRQPNHPFTFLAFADRGPRKGSHQAVQAFLKAFGDDPAYRLLLKSRKREVQINILNPNIEALQQDMSEAELAHLYRSCDCMVFPSMGEGFGLPPREFAATGGPVIATAWGGLADVGQWGIPLRYSLVPAWKGHPDFEQAGLGEWADPDMDALARLMREIADHAEMYQQWAYENAEHVRELYSWRRFAEGVLAVWQDVLERTYGNRDAALATAG